MAKKNEILLSIALEGDQDVKNKLKGVSEEGKRSLADIEKKLGDAGKRFEGLGGKSLGGLKEALAPLSEASGLGGILGSFGAGGLFSRLGAGLLSPAGLVGGITSALLGMAKLGDETQRQKGRLKGLGDAGGFDRLTEQAKQLGVDVSDLQPRFEKFRAFQQKANVNPNVIHPPGFEAGPGEEAASSVRILNGGRDTGAPSTKAYETFSAALFRQIRRDVGDKDKANQIAGEFESGLFQNGLTGDALRGLQTSSPNAANFVTGSLTQRLGRGFANPGALASLLDSGRAQVSATDLINGGAKAAPAADKQADAARGVTESFGALEAASKRLIETFGGDHAGIAKAIDGAAKLVDQGAGKTDQFLHGAENLPGGKSFIGPVRPEDDRSKPPASLGEVFSSDKGDLLGRLVGYIRSGAQSPEGANPFASIGEFLGKALSNPGALQERARPAEGPNALQPPPQQQPAGTPQQGSTGPSLLDSISATLNSLKQQNLKVEGPASGLGIRGDNTDASKNVAGLDNAASQATISLAQFASGLDAILSKFQGGGGSAPVVQAAAGGGMIRRLDGGGGVSGPGTSTSDSIPAMLSDGEYVIKESSARRIGRRALDWLNGGGYARGGIVRRFAGGGPATAGDKAGWGKITALGPGNHEITYDPDSGGAYVDGVLRMPSDPLLQDPLVRRAIERSKAGAKDSSSGKRSKSDFTGIFGGHVFDQSGSYAKGGMVDWPGFADGGLVGGGFGMEAAPALNDAGAPGGVLGHYKIDLGIPGHGDIKVMADEEVARKLGNVARDNANFQTGERPSWYGGR